MAQFLLAVVLEDEIGLHIQKRESFREPLGNWLVAASSTVEAALIPSVLPVLVTVLLYTYSCSERDTVFPSPSFFLAHPVNSVVI